MKAKEFLQQAWLSHGEVELKLERITQLQALATRTTTTLKNTPCGGNVSGSKIETAVVAIQGEIDRLADEIKSLLAINKQVQTAIKAVKNPAERKILEYRYMYFFSWQKISLLMKSSLRNVFYIHDKALKNFSVPLQ